MRGWNLLTRRSLDVDKVEYHIRIGSLNARLAQEQYNTLLIAHSENPNILRQYSVLMRDVYGDDRLAIEILCEADLMEEGNKADLMKIEIELGLNNDIWGVDADQSNHQQQDGELNQNQDQDKINQTEVGKQLQKSDSLSDGNTLNNKSQIKYTSKSASGAVRTGSQKNEILKKLQRKQTKSTKTLIFIFSFLFTSLSTNFMSAVDAGRAFRRTIVDAEYMNIALDYSIYYMFNILTLDQDSGSKLDAVYEEAQGVTYPLLIGVGPDMEITKSTSDELRLTHYIQWVEDAINVMLQLFIYNLEDKTRERGYSSTMKQQLAIITLNVPFAATEEMMIVSHSAYKV
ncbi:MAG: hypothetical protein EZS28_034688, partial [Streblomastix strix]